MVFSILIIECAKSEADIAGCTLVGIEARGKASLTDQEMQRVAVGVVWRSGCEEPRTSRTDSQEDVAQGRAHCRAASVSARRLRCLEAPLPLLAECLKRLVSELFLRALALVLADLQHRLSRRLVVMVVGLWLSGPTALAGGMQPASHRDHPLAVAQFLPVLPLPRRPH